MVFSPRFVEYLWVDGAGSKPQIRSKARLIKLPEKPRISNFPLWSFDGSATYQADEQYSDCMLEPVRLYQDPFRGEGHYLVLCEVKGLGGRDSFQSSRSQFREALEGANKEIDPWLGFEQQYTLVNDGRLLGFPESAYPPPLGSCYCGSGAENVYGRELAEAHAKACLTAGVFLYGFHAEAEPGQWEFQIGCRDWDAELSDPLTVADDVWVARYILRRLGEQYGVRVTLENSGRIGKQSSHGMHVNLSTGHTRSLSNGLNAIKDIVDWLSAEQGEHLVEFGWRVGECQAGQQLPSANEPFRVGVGDRTASIRIPQSVVKQGHGYLQDRRPLGGVDPYRVGTVLISAVLGLDARSSISSGGERAKDKESTLLSSATF